MVRRSLTRTLVDLALDIALVCVALDGVYSLALDWWQRVPSDLWVVDAAFVAFIYFVWRIDNFAEDRGWIIHHWWS